LLSKTGYTNFNVGTIVLAKSHSADIPDVVQPSLNDECPEDSEVRVVSRLDEIPFQNHPSLTSSSRNRKYPQFQPNEVFSLQEAFRKLDVDDKGYLDEATAIKATQQSERQPYDLVRQALKEVELDSSRRVEFEDYVDVCKEYHRMKPGTGLTLLPSAYIKAPRPPGSGPVLRWPCTSSCASPR
jgi:Ca2+-binding EF-hand superfamily protein